MLNPILQQYVNSLKKWGKPTFKDETQIVSGRVVLTVSPNINAAEINSFKIEWPGDYGMDESPHIFIIMPLVLTEKLAAVLIPKIGPALRQAPFFSEMVGRWNFQTLREGDNWVIRMDATS